MDRAINAPIFDSYFVRHSELNREVMLRQYIEKPSTAFFSLAHHRTAQLQNASVRVDLVMARGTEAEKAGDLKLATECYWRAARFGERLRVQGMDIETFLGTPIQKLAYEKLEAVLKKQGKFREAELVAYNLAEAKRASRPRMPAWTSTRQILADTMRWSAMLVQISAVSIVFIGSAAILAFIVLLWPANRWLPRRLRTFAGYTAEFAPVLLLLCCGAFALSYYPFARTFHTYLSARQEITDLRPFMDSFSATLTYGGGISFTLFGQRIFSVYFWWGVITIGTLLIAWMLIRMFRPPAAHSEA
jgi:hypothetical protein